MQGFSRHEVQEALFHRSRQALWGAGLVVGLTMAFVVTRFMQSILFGVSATDWRTFSVATFILAVVAVGSAYIPARRAAGLEPLLALRSE